MKFNDFTNKLHGLYYGTIEEIIYPEDPRNTTKYQIQYLVTLVLDDFGSTRVLCVRQDTFGGLDDYEDILLRTGIRVFVQFPRGNPSVGLITGSPRGYKTGQPLAKGRYWTKRFNQITQSVSKDYEWTVEHDLGNLIKITPTQIIIDDGSTNKITIDKVGMKITVDSGALEVNVKQNASLTVIGDVKVVAKNVDVQAQDVKLVCQSVTATVTGDAKVSATGEVQVTGNIIKLNGEQGDVITTLSQPTCFVSGIPFMGSQTVKAGI